MKNIFFRFERKLFTLQMVKIQQKWYHLSTTVMMSLVTWPALMTRPLPLL